MNKSTRLLILCALLGASGCSWLPSWAGGEPEKKDKLVGERITVLPVEQGLKPDESIQSLAVTLPAPVANPDWAQHGGGLLAATSNLAAKGNFDSSTHGSAGDGEEFENPLIPQPIVAANTVFAMDAVGNISAHDAADVSNKRWESKGISEEDEPAIIGGGLGFADGKLYATSGRGLVAAFDAATGKELWRKSLHIPISSAPKIAEGKVIVVTIDNQTFAMAAVNGDILWSHRGIDETSGLMNSVSPAIDTDTVIVPYSSGEIYALSLTTGNSAWNDALGQGVTTQAGGVFSGISGDPIIDSDVVFAVSNNNSLAVFGTARGQHVWDKPLSSINTPWITGDYMYLLTTDNTLVCFVKYNGKVRWSTQLPQYNDPEDKKDPISWKGPVMVNGKLAVVNAYETMLMVDATSGKIAETQSIPEDVYTAPIVAGGRMYLIDKDATLYELQ